jgi:uncharacterized protein (TIGR02145 family)
MKQKLISILIVAFATISNAGFGQTTSSFKAKLLDNKTKNPIANARIILAKKTKDKPECVINTALTALSKENGDILIDKIPVGEYVIFYNLSGNIDGLLKNLKIGYDPVNHGDISSGFAFTEHISQAIGCPIKVMPGGKVRIVDGNLVVDGYFYAEKLDLGMIGMDGKLMEVSIPHKYKEELSIELNIEIEKKYENNAGSGTTGPGHINAEYDSFTDNRDKKVYKTVKIGTQIWMAENLAYKPTSGNYWAYDNNTSIVSRDGYLYDWETAKEVCPSGWHLPSDAEWTTLTDCIGGGSVAGSKLKEGGTTHWKYPNTGATNETGFTALPGGDRGHGTFSDVGNYGKWWSASDEDPSNAWYRLMSFDGSYVYRSNYDKKVGFSVRCLRD